MTLLFLRHGIRGVDLTKITKDPGDLPTLASGENLTLTGHLYSRNLGKIIHQNLGTPDFIYADVTDTRTVDTALSLANGAKCKKIWVHRGLRDPYLERDPIISEEAKAAANEKIKLYQPKLDILKHKVEVILPDIKLSKITHVSAKGKCKGLLDELDKLHTLSIFCHLSSYEWNDRVSQLLHRARSMVMSVEYPTDEVIQTVGGDILDGIQTLIKKNKLSVIVGHDTNLWLLSAFLGKPYRVDHYGDGSTPPNSGFIFKIKKDHLKVNYLYMDWFGEWKEKKYLNIPFDKNSKHSFDLIKLKVIA